MTPEELVRREVICCVSSLIYHFQQNPEALNGSDYSYEDDILPLCERENWQSAAEGECWVEDCVYDEHERLISTYRNESTGDTSDADGWQELCEEQDIEPDRDEAYEHWVVTDWFARKLAERGEVTGELFNLPIWGRCTTGQMISMDEVIKELAEELT